MSTTAKQYGWWLITLSRQRLMGDDGLPFEELRSFSFAFNTKRELNRSLSMFRGYTMNKDGYELLEYEIKPCYVEEK